MSERNLVVIDEVDPVAQKVYVIDNRGGRFAVSYNATGGIILVPTPGETWSMEKSGYQWFFLERYDEPNDRVPIDTLNIGDGRVQAQKDLHLNGDHLLYNKAPMGAMWWDSFDIPGGGQWLVNLTYRPISIKTLQAFNNQILVDPDLLNVIGTSLTGQPKVKFAQGRLVVYYQYNPQ